MNRWGKLLAISLPLAVIVTAGFRFIQHTESEYSFWVATSGEMAALLAARCSATKTADVCARAQQRTRLAAEFEAHRDAVLLWWWPALIAMLIAWTTVAISGALLAWQAWHRRR